MIAGTSSARITVASKMIPAASAIPNCLTSTPGLVESTKNANISTSAARHEVENHRLQGQHKRPERSREEEESQEHHEAERVREVAVDGMDEIAILGRDAAQARVRRQSVLHTPDRLLRRLGRAVVRRK